MDPKPDSELGIEPLLEEAQPELLHHAARSQVLGNADAHEPLDAEAVEAVAHGGGAGLGREPASLELGREEPAHLRVVGPDTVEGEPGTADQASRLLVLDGPEAEAVLDPMGKVALEGFLRFSSRHRTAAHVAHDAGVGKPARQLVDVVAAPPPKSQAFRLQLGDHESRFAEVSALR